MSMSGKQIAGFLKIFKGLFGFASEEQIKLIGDTIGSYEYDLAVAVLKTHAATHEHLSVPNLLEGLRADSAKRSERRRAIGAETMAAGLRYHARTSWGISKYQDVGDVAVVLMHFGDCWRAIESDPNIEECGKNYIRRLIFAYAEIGLRDAGLTDADAREGALDTVGMQPNETFRKSWRKPAITRVLEEGAAA